MSLSDRVELVKQREAVKKFLSASGHDLCHENRAELAAAFGLELPQAGLAGEGDFALRCIEYRKSLYGPGGPSTDLEAYADRVRELEEQVAHLHRENDELRRLLGTS
jgi:hypothetical protein